MKGWQNYALLIESVLQNCNKYHEIEFQIYFVFSFFHVILLDLINELKKLDKFSVITFLKFHLFINSYWNKRIRILRSGFRTKN